VTAVLLKASQLGAGPAPEPDALSTSARLALRRARRPALALVEQSAVRSDAELPLDVF
jgi:hypothetical protein